MPTEAGMKEAEITVEGHALTFAESMVVRVAVSSMRMSLADPGMRRNLGDRLWQGYDHHLQIVERLLVQGATAGDPVHRKPPKRRSLRHR
jgi:hypothetical protein